jgi:hypothetical protein
MDSHQTIKGLTWVVLVGFENEVFIEPNAFFIDDVSTSPNFYKSENKSGQHG